MKNYLDIRSFEFAPLSEVKAKLSAFMRNLVRNRQSYVITNKGRPQAVLIAYEDYLQLAQGAAAVSHRPSWTLAEWKQASRQRNKVIDEITRLFDGRSLSRKGQKSYKQEVVSGFNRPTKK